MPTGPFLSCIADGVSAGTIDADTAASARETYEESFAALEPTMGPVEADREAGKAVLSALEKAKVEAERRRVLAIRTRVAALDGLKGFKEARRYTGVGDVRQGGKGGGKPPPGGWRQGGEPPKEGPYARGHAAANHLIQLVDGDGGLAGAPGASIKGRYQAIVGALQADMAKVMETFETHTGGAGRGRATLDNLVREAFGEDTGDMAAKDLVKAWQATAERARLLVNRAGGAIGKMDRWGLPQGWDQFAVRTAGKDAWVSELMPRLDRARMVDKLTGAPFTDKRLQAVLGEVWRDIASDGAASRQPGDHLGKGALATQRAEARFLQFKSADDWRAATQRFGSHDDPYALMMQHLDGVARDVAQMDVLGPNPSHQFEWLKNNALHEAQLEELGGNEHAVVNAKKATDTADLMYRHFTGELGTPYGRRTVTAIVPAVAQNLLAGMQLGSAVIQDVFSNPVFAAQARAWTGLSKGPAYAEWAGHLVSHEERAVAARSGFIAEAARVRIASSARDLARATTVGDKVLNGMNVFSRRLPMALFRLSGLTQNMEAARWSFQAEFMGKLHDLRGSGLEELLTSKDAAARAMGETLEARGFTPAEWDALRATPAETPKRGASFMSPVAVGRALGDDMQFRLAEMIERQTRLAVPEPSLWARAHLIGDTRADSIGGMVRRSMAMYHGFTVTQTHLLAAELAMRGDLASPTKWLPHAAGMATRMAIPLVLLGALGVQTKNILSGKDPETMATPQFWGKALLYSGGLAIFGDFLTAAEARNGKSSALTAMGPPGAMASDVWNATGGAAADAASGNDPHEGRQVASLIGRYNPLASTWWTRAAWQHAVTDQLQRLLDPDADEAFRRRAQKLKSETGQESWWAPGEALPSRLPNLAAAFAAPPEHHPRHH